MKLLNFTAKNLFSLGEVSLNLDNQGVVLITGYTVETGNGNGSGKSSLCNKGILWTLFGITPQGTTQDSVQNRFASNTSSGVIHFCTDDGTPYTIVRTRNPNTLSLLDAKGFELSSRKASETQQQINGLLGRTDELFVHSDLFGQGRHSSFFSLSSTEQRQFLEELLPMEQLNEWSAKAATRLSELTTEGTISTTEVTVLERQLGSLVTQVAKLGKERDAYEHTRFETTTRLNNHIQTLSDTLTRYNQSLINFKAQTAAAEQAVTVFVYDADAHKKLHTEASELALVLASTAAEYATTIRQIKELENSRVCPSCARPFEQFPQEKVDKLTVVAAELTRTIMNFDVNLGQRNTELSRLNEAKATLDELVKSAKRLRDQYNVAIQAPLPSPVAFQEELRQVRSKPNPFLESIAATEQEAEGTRNKLSSLRQITQDIEQNKKVVTFWKESFSKTLKVLLFESICPYLSNKANYHLKKLNNPHLSVQFSCTKALASGETRLDFSSTVVNDLGGVGYGALSGGEQQLVNFATGLALSDLASTQTKGSSNILILDEPFAMLDEKNSAAIVSYLTSELWQKRPTILLVSNEEVLKDLIPNRITVVKEDGVSRIKE